MQIAPNAVVSMHYTLTNDEGQEIDSSSDREPLSYVHGQGQLIPGIENALEGKTPGEHVDASVTPENGYGSFDEALVLRLPKDVFQEQDRDQLQPGSRFQGPHPNDQEQQLVYHVERVEDDSVIVNGNHPLAGQQLNFSIDVVDVQPPQAE